MRSLNVVFGIGNLFVFHELYRTIHPTAGKVEAILRTLNLWFFPILFFFNFLYYTDSGSTFFVTAMYLFARKGNYTLSFVVGVLSRIIQQAALCSIAFRQTNAVWVGFVLGDAIIQMYNFNEKGKGSSDIISNLIYTLTHF